VKTSLENKTVVSDEVLIKMIKGKGDCLSCKHREIFNACTELARGNIREQDVSYRAKCDNGSEFCAIDTHWGHYTFLPPSRLVTDCTHWKYDYNG